MAAVSDEESWRLSGDEQTSPLHIRRHNKTLSYKKNLLFLLRFAAREEAFHLASDWLRRSRTLTRSHYLLSLVPHFWLSQELLGPGGQVEFEGEAKHVVHSSQEVQAAFDLRLDLGIIKKMTHHQTKVLF